MEVKLHEYLEGTPNQGQGEPLLYRITLEITVPTACRMLHGPQKTVTCLLHYKYVELGRVFLTICLRIVFLFFILQVRFLCVLGFCGLFHFYA